MRLTQIRLIACLSLLFTGAIEFVPPPRSPLTGSNGLSLAQPAAPTHPNRLAQAVQLELQAAAQLEQHHYAAAAQSFQQAIAIYQSLGETSRRDDAQVGLAKAYLAAGDTAAAIPLWEQIVARAKAQGFGKEIALSNLGLAWFLAGKLPAANTALREAIAGWEAIRALERNDDLDKVTLFEQQAYTYRLLQKVLIAQNQPTAALEMAERSRSRALVEILAQRSQGNPIAPPTLSQIRQIAQTQNSTLVAYSLIGQESRVLGTEPDSPTALFIWVIAPNGTISFRQVDLAALGIASLTDLITQVRQTTIGVRGRGLGIVSATREARGSRERPTANGLKQLHQLLIQPIADLLPSDPQAHVTLIPQGALFLVPFAALQDRAGTALIEQHTLLTAPSIQVLDLTNQQRRTRQPTTPAIVVGNPTMPVLPATPDQPAEPLPALPGADREARAIASLLKTQPLIGDQATKAAIVPLLKQARFIHLATHGLLDRDANLNKFGQPISPPVRTARASRVFVTPGAVIFGPNVQIGGVSADRALAREKVVRVEMSGTIALAPSGADNGFLSAKQILDLQLNAELVVLSACDTGRGRITGEGVVGLSRALMAAGVASVVVSLWAIPDAPTAALMTEFYRVMLTQPDKAQALRQAMLTTRKQYPNPRDWAAFTLIGQP